MKKFTTHLLCGAAALLFMGACSENKIWIGGEQGGSSGGTTGTSLVSFYASVESRNMTRSMSPVRKNVQVAVYAYPATASGIVGAPQSQGNYLTPTPGILQGVNGYKMYIPTGNYDFFAVSDNTQFAPPTFTNGVSEPLMNGVDYLWWGGLQQDVTAAQAGIPILFGHSATQVIFEVQQGEGVTINELVLAHIWPPTEGAAMNLSSGAIPPASGWQSTQSKMTVSGMMAQYTMLPIMSATPLKVSFDVRINGETTPRTFTSEVDLTNGEFKAGDSYRFLAVIRGNEVTFPEVNVRNWVDVDETGKPLYPWEQ